MLQETGIDGPSAGGDLASRRAEVLAVRDGGVENRLFVNRWDPPGTSRGTVICAHGLTTAGIDFEPLAIALGGRSLCTIAPDMPGHGRSRCIGSAPEIGTGGTCGHQNVARCLAGLIQHYTPDPATRFLVGSSWGAVRAALFLARRRLPVKRLVLIDPALEWHPFGQETLDWLIAESKLSFATPEACMASLDRRDRELLRNRDSERIDPQLLRRYLAGRIAQRDGRYVVISNPFREGIGHQLPPDYPDMHAALSAIAAERILLLYGSESPYRDSATERRILETVPRVESAVIPDAGHPPRLLTPHEWDVVGDFLLQP
jgi:pimeloyl-ACP methyl ester carboxylesterase